MNKCAVVKARTAKAMVDSGLGYTFKRVRRVEKGDWEKRKTPISPQPVVLYMDDSAVTAGGDVPYQQAIDDAQRLLDIQEAGDRRHNKKQNMGKFRVLAVLHDEHGRRLGEALAKAFNTTKNQSLSKCPGGSLF